MDEDSFEQKLADLMLPLPAPNQNKHVSALGESEKTDPQKFSLARIADLEYQVSELEKRNEFWLRKYTQAKLKISLLEAEISLFPSSGDFPSQ